MRHLILVAVLLGTLSPAYAAPSCPGDTVVWLNQNSHVYHLPTDRWYGRTKHGAYECERQTIAGGAHQSGARHRAAGRASTAKHRPAPTKQDQVDNAKPASSVENPF